MASTTMPDKTLDPTRLRERLWDELDDARIVMVGLVGGRAHHMQPMAAFGDPRSDAIWFFTKRDTDLVKDAGPGHDATICVMARDKEFQASIHGVLMPDQNRQKIDQYWSSPVAAWYPGGKQDPDLALMRLDPTDARIWVSNSGLISYALKIIKANVTHTLPDVGGQADITL